MSPAQTGMWLDQLRSPQDLSQLCFAAWWLEGTLDDGALQSALHDLHWRHELLHSRFVLEQDPMVRPAGDVLPPTLLRLPGVDTHEDARHAVERALACPLDIASGQVWRACVVRAAEPGANLFCTAVHHIAFDAASEAILARDLSIAYAARLRRQQPSFPALAPSWSAVISACRRPAAGSDLGPQRAFWRSALAGLPELRLPPGQSGAGSLGVADVAISDAKLGPWLAAARTAGGTRTAAVLAYVASRLADRTGQHDFALGVPVTKRISDAFDDAIGCLIDSLCVRLSFSPGGLSPAAATVVAHQALRASLEARDVPLREVISIVKPPRSVRHPLFQAIFAAVEPTGPLLKFPDCRSTFIRPDPPRAVAELVIEFVPGIRGWPTRLHITYRPEAVSDSFVRDLVEHM